MQLLEPRLLCSKGVASEKWWLDAAAFSSSAIRASIALPGLLSPLHRISQACYQRAPVATRKNKAPSPTRATRWRPPVNLGR